MTKLFSTSTLATATLVLMLSQTALAHVSISPAEVPQGSYQKLSFRVTHGCEGSSTTSVRITLPESIQGAKPMVKAGWKIALEKKTLAQPYMMHGKVIKETVSTITWEGGILESAYFDEFSILAKMPIQVGSVPIAVTQICEKGRLDWVEVAKPSDKQELTSPAPVLKVIPAKEAEHHH